MQFTVGEEIDGLEFLRVVTGSGRNAAYLVRDTITERLEYLKRVPDSVQQNAEELERFLREARLHARLSHPNIAQFHSVRRLGGVLVMMREWIEGESLASKVKNGPLPIPQAIDYVGQALLALSYAHGQGVVHRNVTSDSLLITESGVVKLTGFDLARSNADTRLTRAGVIMGSVHYMAPEQVKGLVFADERSDLYAAGVVLYEAITGRRPFEGESHFDVMMAQVESPLTPPARLNPAVAPALDRVVCRALEKNPAERFASVEEFRQQLLALTREEFDETVTVLPADAIGPGPAGLPVAPSVVPVQASPGLTAQPAPAAPPPSAAVPVRAAAAPVDSPSAMDPDLSVAPFEWPAESAGLSRVLGITIAGFSVGLALLYAGWTLLNK